MFCLLFGILVWFWVIISLWKSFPTISVGCWSIGLFLPLGFLIPLLGSNWRSKKEKIKKFEIFFCPVIQPKGKLNISGIRLGKVHLLSWGNFSPFLDQCTRVSFFCWIRKNMGYLRSKGLLFNLMSNKSSLVSLRLKMSTKAKSFRETIQLSKH